MSAIEKIFIKNKFTIVYLITIITFSTYCYVIGFTLVKHLQEIETAFSSVSEEEIPMASFISMGGNALFLEFIHKHIE